MYKPIKKGLRNYISPGLIFGSLRYTWSRSKFSVPCTCLTQNLIWHSISLVYIGLVIWFSLSRILDESCDPRANTNWFPGLELLNISHVGTTQIFLIFSKTTVAVCHGPDFHFYRQKSLHKLFVQIWNNRMLHTYIYTIFLFKHASPSNKMLISRRGGGGGRRVTKYIENIYNDILDLRGKYF